MFVRLLIPPFKRQTHSANTHPSTQDVFWILMLQGSFHRFFLTKGKFSQKRKKHHPWGKLELRVHAKWLSGEALATFIYLFTLMEAYSVSSFTTVGSLLWHLSAEAEWFSEAYVRTSGFSGKTGMEGITGSLWGAPGNVLWTFQGGT